VFEPPDAPPQPLAPPEAPTSEAQGTVLLVEDELAVREATKRMLRKFGFSVVEAKNGQEALEVWERSGRSVDVVLTDVVMPKMGGAAMVKVMRAQRPDVRVVFMSGYTQGALEPSSVDESCTRFLPKPFTADQLVRTLRELVPASR
jgi:two-component system cell cycle sensor histidine kinase/response regulator CckA